MRGALPDAWVTACGSRYLYAIPRLVFGTESKLNGTIGVIKLLDLSDHISYKSILKTRSDTLPTTAF
jgi:hypothetical protein